MAVNLAVKYASELDQEFTHGSYTDNWINKKYDFDGCSKLKTVILPENLENIQDYAFVNCNKVTNVSLTNSVTTIKRGAFQGTYLPSGKSRCIG